MRFNFFKNWFPVSLLHRFTLLVLLTALIVGCTEIAKNNVDEVVFSYQSYVGDSPQIDFETFDSTKLTLIKNSNIGFFNGTIWTTIQIMNNGNKEKSIVIANNDKLNHNYSLYQLDPITTKINLLSGIRDFKDGRTFKFLKPNFRINLPPNSKNYYYIHSTSDGRMVETTPFITSLDNYLQLINKNTYKNVFFYGAIFIILLINFFFWRTFKNKIHGFYSLYIFFTFLLYSGFDGYLYDQGMSGHVVDHVIFIALRGYLLFMVLFTSSFLKIDQISPLFYLWMKRFSITLVAVMTSYQFLFFYSSIAHLHNIENILSLGWMILILTMLIISIKHRRPEFKYYMVALLFYLICVMLGIMTPYIDFLSEFHTTYNIEFNTFYKIGTALEVIIFTYTIVAVLKLNEKVNTNQQNTSENKDVTSKTNDSNIQRMDFLAITQLIKTNLNNAEEWANFQQKVNEVSPNFISEIKQNYPKLTKNDLRLMLLVKLGFSQREISKILFIEEGSVKKSKQRLRKKLILSSEITLKEFLSKH